MDYDYHPILTRIFHRLRREGFNLGVAEYLDALNAIEGGWETKSTEDLKQLVLLLWCSSFTEQGRLQIIWDSIVATDSSKQNSKTLEKELEASSKPPNQEDETSQSRQEKIIESKSVVSQLTSEISFKPVQAPCFTPAELEEDIEFQNDWLVSRRYMVYIWRYLRRPVADGPEDELDVTATVEKAAQQGFFLQSVYRRREINHAHLLLLIDREGSMTPFHRFTRDLVETAQYESNLQRVDVGYFHNIPAQSVYQDSHLTEPIPFEEILEKCDRETSVLIVSDAGAARGYRRMERVRATTEVIFDIKRYTHLIAWLNPMPKERWTSTSAQILSYLVPMYPMDKEGLSQAINILQGQPWQS
ncbi:hypothetical protein NUACC21_60520 [Scytonema sp. NUACC21]